MIRVGSVWKRTVDSFWNTEWVGLPVVVVEVNDGYIFYRYPSLDYTVHHMGDMTDRDFNKYFTLVEDVCQT